MKSGKMINFVFNVMQPGIWSLSSVGASDGVRMDVLSRFSSQSNQDKIKNEFILVYKNSYSIFIAQNGLARLLSIREASISFFLNHFQLYSDGILYRTFCMLPPRLSTVRPCNYQIFEPAYLPMLWTEDSTNIHNFCLVCT